MSDTWINVLEALEPTYKDLAMEMYGEPTIKPMLWKSQQGRWYVGLEEQWPDELPRNFDSSMLDKRIHWTVQQLELWPGCSRQGYDTWIFKSKKDAEKFITLFSLQWPQ